MTGVISSQSGDIDGMATCTVCYKDPITENSFQHVATSLHKESILQEFKSLSDAWQMFQGILIFGKYLGKNTIPQREEPPKPCSMCLVKIINLVEASYVMTHTYRSGADKIEKTRKASREPVSSINIQECAKQTNQSFESTRDCPTAEITSSRPKRSGGRSLMDRNPGFHIDIKSSKSSKKINSDVILSPELETGGTLTPPDPIKRPIGSQPRNSTVSPNTPVKKRGHSPEDGLKLPGTVQREKVKIIQPQKKTKSLGSVESVADVNGGIQEQQEKSPESEDKKATMERPRIDTNTETPLKPIITDQRSATFQPSTEIGKSSALEELPQWKTVEFRSTYLKLLEKAISSKALNQQLGSANDMEKKVFEYSHSENVYVLKMTKLLDYCKVAVNKTKTAHANEDNEKAISGSKIEEQNEAKERSQIITDNCETRFVSAQDKKIEKINNFNRVAEEVAMGKCGFLETSKNIAHLKRKEHASIVNENPKSTPGRREKIGCTICGEKFPKRSLIIHMKSCSSSIDSQANTTDGKSKSSLKSGKKTGKRKKKSVSSSKTVLAKKLVSGSEGFCSKPPEVGNSEDSE